MGASYNNLAVHLQLDRGEFDDALALHRKALGIRETLAAAHPQIPDYRDAVTMSHNNIGLIQMANEDLEGAARSFQAAIDILENLVAEHAEVSAYSDALASAYHNQGLVKLRSKNPEAARENVELAITIREKLMSQDPRVAEYAVGLADSCMILGKILSQSSDFKSSSDYFSRAIRLAAEPADAGHSAARKILLSSYADRARARASLNEYEQAVSDWNEAIGLSAGDQAEGFRMERAWTRAKAQDHEAAAAEAEELSGKHSGSAGMLYKAACVFSLSAAAARSHPELQAERRQELFERYAERAIELLSKASALVPEKSQFSAHLREDPDLEAVRSCDAFNDLCQRLSAPE